MKHSVSLCMIVKNEEEYLSKCLASAQNIVEEIILVDTGSTDRTIEIAEEHGAKVYFFPWNNSFSDARNESLRHATKEWILILDGDDVLFPEAQEELRLFLESSLDKQTIYFFETLNYQGDRPDDDNITINLNPRLFPNSKDIYYEGEVHNQLVYPQSMSNTINPKIQIHHYGYLMPIVTAKDKKNRTISLLLKQLERNPNDAFAHFNLGTEYAGLNRNDEALACYYRSFETFQPKLGYSYPLISRIVLVNYKEKNYDKAMEFIELGLSYYPLATNLYFYKATILKELGRPLSQVENLLKCLELGEPPSEYKYHYGTGTFKAAYELGCTYLGLKEYDRAYEAFTRALDFNPKFLKPLYYIAYILKVKESPLNIIKSTLEAFVQSLRERNFVLGEIFYFLGYYKTSLEYFNLQKEPIENMDALLSLKARALLLTGNFTDLFQVSQGWEALSKESAMRLQLHRVLCYIIEEDFVSANRLLNSCESQPYYKENKKIAEVHRALLYIYLGEPPEDLSTIENEEGYLEVILDICEVLLVNKLFDDFKLSVKLLNLINNNKILLELGKLYYKHGYMDFAKKEILRSIEIFESYDREAFEILMA